MSTKRYVVSGPCPRRGKLRSRNKNGGSHSAGSGEGSRVAAGGDLCRTGQVGKGGLGSPGDGHPRGDAPGGGGGGRGAAGCRGRVSPADSCRLRAAGALPREARDSGGDGARGSR